MPNPTSHAEMIAAVNEAIEGAEMEAQGYRNGASISDGDERLLREAEEYQRHADTLRAVLRLLERTLPTDTQADLTERARAIADASIDARVCCDKYPGCVTEAWRVALAKEIAAFAQSEREAAAAEARRAAIEECAKYAANRYHETPYVIAKGILALASPAAPQEETR